MGPKEISQKLDQLLRLDTFPVGVKFYTREEDLPKGYHQIHSFLVSSLV